MKDQGYHLGDQANTGAAKGTKVIHLDSLEAALNNLEGEDHRQEVSKCIRPNKYRTDLSSLEIISMITALE